MMTTQEKHQYLMTCEQERFGSEGAERKHHSRDYNAYKSGWQRFLESGSKFSACTLPERAQNTVRQGKVDHQLLSHMVYGTGKLQVGKIGQGRNGGRSFLGRFRRSSADRLGPDEARSN